MVNLKSIADKIVNSDKTISIAANIIAIGTFMALVWSGLDSKIESKVKERLEPYEYLQEALSLSQSGQYDQSMEPFQKAFNELSKQDLTASRLKSVVNPYLSAMVYVEHSHKYSHNFKDILKFINNKLPDDSSILSNVAWVYFENGDLKNARSYFVKSLKIYSAEDKIESAEFAIWGMVLTLIAEENLEKATKLYHALFQLNSQQYSPSETVNYPITSSGGYGEKYIRMYAGFKTTYTQFMNQVKETYGVQVNSVQYEGELNFELLKE